MPYVIGNDVAGRRKCMPPSVVRIGLAEDLCVAGIAIQCLGLRCCVCGHIENQGTYGRDPGSLTVLTARLS